MAVDEKKRHFCEETKCVILIFLVVAVAIVAVAVVTFVDKDIRIKRRYESSKLPWWKQTIVYQIYPRSFQDSNDDGTGDLAGITRRLDYISSLGVGAIWISPFYKSPQRDFGYDIVNYTSVDPLFGTLDDFKNLTKEAKKKNIKIIVDFVPNHTSNDSVWFQESRKRSHKYKDYYIWNKGVKRNGSNKRDPPNNWLSVFGGSAWKWDDIRQEYYYHAFLESQPDLNFGNPDVRKELIEAMRFWLKKGVMGFRLDALKFMYESDNVSLNEPGLKDYEYVETEDHNLTTNSPKIYDVLKQWRALCDEFKKKDNIDRFIISESYGLTHAIRDEYYKVNTVPFNFDLITKLNKNCNGKCLKDILIESLKGLGASTEYWPNFVLGNHDRSRLATRMGTEMVDAMNMLLLTLPGTPTCYYGDEIGMEDSSYTFAETQDPFGLHFNASGYKGRSRDPERSPMQWDESLNAGFSSGTPWLHVNRHFKQRNVKMQSESKTQTNLQVFKTLAQLRKLPSFNNYNITFLDVSDPNILAYKRWAQGRERYVVIMNLGQSQSAIDIGGAVSHSVGQVVALTSKMDYGIYKKGLHLEKIVLNRGDGLVLKLVK